MKHLTYLFFLLSVSLFSCQEVIELELEDAGPKLVVDAALTNTPFQNQVILTRSGSYYDPGDYATVSDAVVTISGSDGQSWTLTEQNPGVYTASGLIGRVGEQYTLSIESDGQTVTGVSDMLGAVPVDSLTFEASNGGFGIESDFIMRAHFADPATEDLYIRFLVTVNDTLDQGIYLYDGGVLADDEGVFPFPGLALIEGDQVTVTALRIDKPVYDYFSQLAEVAGLGFGPGAAAPANPESNLTSEGDILGYFGATSVTAISDVAD